MHHAIRKSHEFIANQNCDSHNLVVYRKYGNMVDFFIRVAIFIEKGGFMQWVEKVFGEAPQVPTFRERIASAYYGDVLRRLLESGKDSELAKDLLAQGIVPNSGRFRTVSEHR